MIISVLLAQLPASSIENALFAYGPMGVILGWFMLRGEAVVKEIRGLSHRIDGLTKAMLIDVLSRENPGSHTRKIAQEQLEQIKVREERELRAVRKTEL